MGAAVAGGVGVGLYKDFGVIAQMNQIAEVISKQATVESYQKLRFSKPATSSFYRITTCWLNNSAVRPVSAYPFHKRKSDAQRRF